MTDWVLAVERAYVDAAMKRVVPEPTSTDLPRARAAAGAVASRYLAVGTPRSFGLVVEGHGGAAQALAAHRAWFAPTDVRCAGSGAEELAATLGARAVTLDEALACDIVCILAPMHLEARHFRRGTHVNVLVPCTLDDDLTRIAAITHEMPGLGELAAGLVDGRQLDELTIFVLGDARIALAAL